MIDAALHRDSSPPDVDALLAFLRENRILDAAEAALRQVAAVQGAVGVTVERRRLAMPEVALSWRVAGGEDRRGTLRCSLREGPDGPICEVEGNVWTDEPGADGSIRRRWSRTKAGEVEIGPGLAISDDQSAHLAHLARRAWSTVHDDRPGIEDRNGPTPHDAG